MTPEEYNKTIAPFREEIEKQREIIRKCNKIINDNEGLISDVQVAYVEANRKYKCGDKVVYNDHYWTKNKGLGIIGDAKFVTLGYGDNSKIIIKYEVHKIKKDGTISVRFWSERATENELELYIE